MRRKTATPDDIAVAAVDMRSLARWAARIVRIGQCAHDKACAAVPKRNDEPTCVWVDPRYQSYRSAWLKAQEQGLVEPLESFGEWVDVDHLCARSWAIKAGFSWVRLFPVWAEVNRSAGAGREKSMLRGNAGESLARRGGIVFASDLQIMKIIGHPVDTAHETGYFW